MIYEKNFFIQIFVVHEYYVAVFAYHVVHLFVLYDLVDHYLVPKRRKIYINKNLVIKNTFLS